MWVSGNGGCTPNMQIFIEKMMISPWMEWGTWYLIKQTHVGQCVGLSKKNPGLNPSKGWIYPCFTWQVRFHWEHDVSMATNCNLSQKIGVQNRP